MRLISRPACAASLRQRCTSFSSSSSSGDSFLSGWRSMPGTSPATSQFDWLVSMTAISVLSWSKAARDRLRSFDCGMGHSIGLLDSAEGGMPSPLAPYHLHPVEVGIDQIRIDPEAVIVDDGVNLPVQRREALCDGRADLLDVLSALSSVVRCSRRTVNRRGPPVGAIT